MEQPIVYVDTSRVREGTRGELEAAMKRLAAFVEAKVPQLISYAFYLGEDRSEMTVVAVHPNSESLEYHLDVGREEFRKFAPLIELVRIDVYGHVNESVRQRLHQKTQMLGNGTVTVHAFQAGFAR